MLWFANQTLHYILRYSFPQLLGVLVTEGSQLFPTLEIALCGSELPHSRFSTLLGETYIKRLVSWRIQRPNLSPQFGATPKGQLTSRAEVPVVLHDSSTPPLPTILLPLLLC